MIIKQGQSERVRQGQTLSPTAIIISKTRQNPLVNLSTSV
jgi:hypothetical protein